MRATLRTVDLIKVFKREFQLRRERLDPSTELAFSERREFVEKRLDYCWIEDNHRKLEDKPGIGEREKNYKELGTLTGTS
jgi:hypothetical protein